MYLLISYTVIPWCLLLFDIQYTVYWTLKRKSKNCDYPSDMLSKKNSKQGYEQVDQQNDLVESLRQAGQMLAGSAGL